MERNFISTTIVEGTQEDCRNTSKGVPAKHRRHPTCHVRDTCNLCDRHRDDNHNRDQRNRSKTLEPQLSLKEERQGEAVLQLCLEKTLPLHMCFATQTADDEECWTVEAWAADGRAWALATVGEERMDGLCKPHRTTVTLATRLR